MSVKALSAVFDDSRADGAAFVVLLAMADWADHQGRCYPSFAQIAKKARVSRATVATSIKTLVDLGELERVTRGHGPARADEDDDAASVRIQYRNLYRICLRRAARQLVQAADHQVVQSSDHQVDQPLDQQVVRELDQIDPFTGKSVQVVQSLDHQAPRPAEAGSPIDTAEVVQSTRSHIRNKPSGRPSEELKAGAPPRPPDQKPENPDDNVGVITRVVHEVLDITGAVTESPELYDGVKWRCSKLKILYDSGTLTKAVQSALWQRAHPSF